MPKGEAAESHRHRAAKQKEGHDRTGSPRAESAWRSPGQHPEEDDALVGGGLSEGAGFRWSLVGGNSCFQD